MRLGTAAVVVALIGVMAPGAHAAIFVVGNGQAHSCSVAALSGRDTHEADDQCTAGIENEPLSLRDLAATYVNRCVIRYNMRLFDKALADCDKAILYGSSLSNPELGLGYINLAAAQIALKHFDDALRSADRALSLGTLRPEMAFFYRAQAEDYLGNYAAAYRDYKQTLVLAPDFAVAQENLKRFRVVTKPAGS